MKNKRIFIKFISIFLLISLLIGLSGSVLLKPKKAKAFIFPAVVPTSEVPLPTSSIFTKEWILDNIVRVAARFAIQAMITDITNWARSGFRGNQPFAVANWANYLKMAVDIGSARFIEEFDLVRDYLCPPFAYTLSQKLGLTSLYNYQPRYYVYAACTIGTIVGNVEEFFRNPSISTYGWGAWTALAQPQNNIYGSFYLAAIRRAELESESREAKKTEATVSGGYQNFTECMKTGTMGICIDEMLRTPGVEIHDALEDAIGADLEWLVSSDEISELIAAFITGIWNRLLGGFYNVYDPYKDLNLQGQLPPGGEYPGIDVPIPEIEVPETPEPEMPDLPSPEDFWREQFPEGPPWEQELIE